MFFTHVSKLKRPSTSNDSIEFSSDRLLVGIVYHLLDEGLAVAVDKTSAWETADRLARQSARGDVRRWYWRSMTNGQRLCWLLTRAQTTAVIDGRGTASLHPMHPGWPPRLVVRFPTSASEA